MKKIILTAAVAMTLTGCATGLSPAGVGLITDVSGPITATTGTGSKTGSACATSYVGIYIAGDASTEAAKKAGGIKNVASVDYHTKGYYPFFGKTCIIVTGN